MSRAISNFRPFTVSITGVGVPDGFIGAVDTLIKRLEAEHAQVPKLPADNLVAVTTFISSNIPFEGYAVTIDADFAAATYTVAYVETRPNVLNDIE